MVNAAYYMDMVNAAYGYGYVTYGAAQISIGILEQNVGTKKLEQSFDGSVDKYY